MTAKQHGKFRRGLRLTARIIGIPLLVGGAALVVWAWSTLPKTAGEVKLAGLAGEVEIFRDGHGVPHIFADNTNDAYFALGYVHAQDRLWQMEFTRRLGAGRLAEVTGEAGLGADRFLRTLGLYRQAEVAAGRLSPKARAALEAYAAGVNAWLDNGAVSLPPEFLLLNHDPEPWRITDSIVWGHLLAYQLSTNWRGELYRAGLARGMEPERIAELWPGDSPDSPITLDVARRTAKLNIEGLLAAVPPELRSHSASNAWVLSGARSAAGAPILANDPHLGFTAPNTWYLARIETPELRTVGATAPGVPFTILGHNGNVAWGMTSTGGDTQDLFVETVDRQDPARYLTPDGPRPFETRKEIIKVKGGEDVVLTLRATRHGPVISDVLEDSKGLAADETAVIALASASDGPGNRTVEALAAMPGARNAAEFERNAGDFQAPLVNIFFADRDGVIGLVTPGLVPIRRMGEGRYPVDGASGDYDWTGFVPATDMPRVANPAAGVVVNANNRLVGPDYPYMITRNWDDPYRAERIHELLGEREKHSIEDGMRQQEDILSVAARQLVAQMATAAGNSEDERLRRALAMLANWDFRMVADRPEPLIYTAWLRHAVIRIAGDELGDDFSGYWRPRPAFVEYVLTAGAHWCGGLDCAAEMRESLVDALDEITAALGDDMASWRWGDLHKARFDHRILSQIPLVGGPASLSIPTSGGDNTIGRGMIAGSGNDPYAHIHGAGYKAVYDLGDPANSRFMIPAGQSGNPFSGHYADLLQPWRDGEYIRIAGDRESLAAAGLSRLALVPADQ
jgi:penicillin amidase